MGDPPRTKPRWHIKASGSPTEPDIEIEADHIDASLAYRYPLLEIVEINPPLVRTRQEVSETERRNRVIRARRKTLRAAFDVIRRRPEHKTTVSRFARALGGKDPMTDEVLAEAIRILEMAKAATSDREGQG